MKSTGKENTAFTTLLSGLYIYRDPRVRAMFFLGFSAGLPLLLLGGTFMARLKDSGLSLAGIGFLSWVAMAHSIKILWAPFVDSTPIFWLSGKMGRRRSWMLCAQLLLLISIAGMALCGPDKGLALLAFFAVLAGFASATQDIVIDAYRIESADTKFQGALAAAYVFGYRIALLAAGAGALHLAFVFDWEFSYKVMASLVLIGIFTNLLIKEEKKALPLRKKKLFDGSGYIKGIKTYLDFLILAPFADLWQRFRFLSIAILLFISLFRISDIFMGVMANPFYLDLGFTKAEIANIAAAFGLLMTLLGAALGGVLLLRFKLSSMLIFTAVLAPLTNLTFSFLSYIGPELYGLVLAIMADNISSGMATAVFLAYLSSLTNTAYTATQYALFSSLMSLPGQFLAGFTGMLAEHIGWFYFFISSAVIGLPAIFLAVFLAGYSKK